ncbi:hypothetical protein Tco_0292109 [Tanacetum coccineum]
MDFMSFMMQGIDGEFYFKPEGGFDESTHSNKYMNNEAPIVDVALLNTAPPPHVADNSEGLRDSPLEDIVVGDAETLRVSAKDAGTRKQVGDSSLKNPKQKHWRVLPQANTAVGNASDPLDVDSDPDFHAHVTPLSCNKYLNEIDLQELCDIHDRAYMRQVVLDNVLKNQTRQLISALSKAMASCDELRERETAKYKAYSDLEKKCNEALQDLEKNSLVLDIRAEISTLQSEVERMQGEYSRLVLEEKKWVNYTQTLSALQSKMSELERERERLQKSEAQLMQDIDSWKHDRAAVVSKVIPHVAQKLVHSDEMGVLVAKLIKAAIFQGRCDAFEEVAKLEEPFDLSKNDNIK